MPNTGYQACSQILTANLEDQPIGEIILDPQEDTLNLSYNPKLVSPEELKSKLKEPRRQLKANFIDCPLKQSAGNAKLCPSCRKYAQISEDKSQKGLVHIPIGAPHAETWIHLPIGTEDVPEAHDLAKSLRRTRDKLVAFGTASPGRRSLWFWPWDLWLQERY
jgi:hypothetical protein